MMIYSIVLFILVGLFIDVYKKYKEAVKKHKIHIQWKKIAKAYPKDDFGTINKAIKKLKKLENDPLIKLLEIEKYLYGKTVFQDKKKAVDLLLEIDSIKIPEKTKLEKSTYTKKHVEKWSKKTRKKLKKEKYLKSIKKLARDTWNNNGFWALKHDYYSEIHSHVDEPIEIVTK